METRKKIFFAILCLLGLGTLAACGPAHNVGKSWKIDGEKHWHECIDDGCDEKFDLGSHDFEITTRAATCSEDGFEEKRCKICNYYVKTVTEEASGHEIELHEAVEASCTEAGNIEYYECKVCHKCFEDALATKPLENNSWLRPALQHDLKHVDSKVASYTSSGWIEHYECKTCGKFFSDSEGKVELSQDIITPQLVSSVAVAKTIDVGETLIVRGVVAGVSATGASSTFTTHIVLKDENSNDCMGLSGNNDANNSLSQALGSTTALKMPYPVGTIIEVPVVKKKTSATYACGNAYVEYLLFIDQGEELSTYVKGTGNAKFDLTDPNIPVVKDQSDFFKFLGLLNGSNDATTENFEYSAEVSGSNTFKLVKLENIEGVCQSDPSTKEPKVQYWRPCFGEEYNTWAKTSISNSANATNKIGAHQSYYPSFNNYFTWVNTGKTFSEMLFPDSYLNPGYRTWSSHITGNKDCYALFVGGNDYYAHFVILDSDWVVDRVPAIPE